MMYLFFDDKKNQDDDDDGESKHIVGLAKRQKGGETYPEQSKDEQAISESALNKLVGTADVYDLEVISRGNQSHFRFQQVCI